MTDTFSQLSTYLTESEKDVLSKCESVIERGLKSFIEVGTALLAIRDNRLYREAFPTFEAYCQDKWGMTRQYAHYLIGAVEVTNDLSTNGLQILPTSERQARPLVNVDPDLRAELWQTAVDTAPNGKVTGAHVQQVVDEYRESKPHVSHNSGNNEWYTPVEYIYAARRVIGDFDLDPASSLTANEVIKARIFYNEQDDGLQHEWSGVTWMNPPYASQLIGKFTEKLTYHFREGDISAALVLVNNATETRWFQGMAAFASAICFLSSRINFWSPSGEKGQPLQGQVIIYFGDNARLFCKEFNSFGFMVEIVK